MVASMTTEIPVARATLRTVLHALVDIVCSTGNSSSAMKGRPSGSAAAAVRRRCLDGAPRCEALRLAAPAFLDLPVRESAAVSGCHRVLQHQGCSARCRGVARIRREFHYDAMSVAREGGTI